MVKMKFIFISPSVWTWSLFFVPTIPARKHLSNQVTTNALSLLFFQSLLSVSVDPPQEQCSAAKVPGTKPDAIHPRSRPFFSLQELSHMFQLVS